MKTSLFPLALTIAAGLLLAIAPAVPLGPFSLSNSSMRYLTDLFILISIAELWNLLAGFGGIVSVGQHAFIGAGAYCFFGLSVLSGINPLISLMLTLPFGALISLPVYAVLARLRTAYFTIGSWVTAEFMSLIAGKLPGFGGGSGLSIQVAIIQFFGSDTPTRILRIYWLALLVLTLIVLCIIAMLHSRYGLALKAIRDNENAAMAFGVNPNFVRALLFVICGAFLGLLGAINCLQKLRINPAASFSLTDGTVYIIFIVVIGGIGRVSGPIIGAVLFVALRENLSGYGSIYLIVLGIVAIVTMIVEPTGIAGLMDKILRRSQALTRTVLANMRS